MKQSAGNGKPVTLGDVARESGYAISTVSTALSGGYGISPATRASIRAVADRLGFQPNPHARSLIKGRSTDTIGLFAAHLDLGVVTTKLQILQRLLAERNYVTPIYALTDSNQAQAMENLLRLRPLAILCNVSKLEGPTLKALEQYGHAGGVVVCYDRDTNIDCDCVYFDRDDSIRLATRHLVDIGHRQIGLFDASNGWDDSVRLAGFQDVMREAGAEERPEWLFLGADEAQDMGIALARQIIEMDERPTALIIPDDGISASFIACVLQHGLRVPEDISVVSHDDMAVAKCSTVPLTTVSQPVNEIANSVMTLLMERLDGSYSGPSRRIIVKGELIERASTAPLPVAIA